MKKEKGKKEKGKKEKGKMKKRSRKENGGNKKIIVLTSFIILLYF